MAVESDWQSDLTFDTSMSIQPGIDAMEEEPADVPAAEPVAAVVVVSVPDDPLAEALSWVVLPDEPEVVPDAPVSLEADCWVVLPLEPEVPEVVSEAPAVVLEPVVPDEACVSVPVAAEPVVIPDCSCAAMNPAMK